MQLSDPHPHMTVFLTAWAAIGPIIGLVIGNALQSRGQHKQWRRDNVRQECRELLGQLSATLFAFLDWVKVVRFEQHNGKASENAIVVTQQYSEAVVNLHRNLGSRLLIANEIKDAKIALRWQKEIIEAYLNDYDDEKLDVAYQNVIAEIVKIGLKD